MKKLSLILSALFCLFNIAAIDQIAGQDISGLDQIAGQSISGIDQVAGEDLPSGGACETIAQQDTTGGSSGNFGDATIYNRAGSITTTSAYTLCKVTIGLKKLGTPSGTVSVKLYADSGGFPTGSALATASETLTESSLTTAFQEFTFTISYSLSDATRYHISAESDTLNDVSNKFYVDYYNTGTERISYYDTSWSGSDTSAIIYHIAYE